MRVPAALLLALLSMGAGAQGFNLERVPEPPVLIRPPLHDQLREEKRRLDGRHDGVRHMFESYQSQCGTVERSKTAPCQAQRKEVLDFARAYIVAACGYKKANADELNRMMDESRAEVRRYQDLIKKVGIEATANAYEQWTDVSKEQLGALEKEKIDHVIQAALTAARDLGQIAASRIGQTSALLTPGQAQGMVDALKRVGVSDDRLLKPILELAQTGDQARSVRIVQEYIDTVKSSVDLSVRAQESSRPEGSRFERQWAQAQAAVTIIELSAKALGTRATGTALASVGPVAAGAPGAIQLAGHGSIGYFWTYRSMAQLASLEEIQLVQIQMHAGMMEGPIARLRLLKERRAPFVGDKSCGT